MKIIIYLLICVIFVNADETEDQPELTPEFLEKLLEEKRYDEYEKYMDMPPGSSRPDTDESAGEYPMMNKDLFEGDILLSSQQKEEARQGLDWRKRPNWRWPGRPAMVPYVITNQFSQNDRRTIESAIQFWNQRVQCIKWQRRSNQREYVQFISGRGCSARIGRAGNQPQPVTLGRNCVHRGVILHEMEHAIGFAHEHNRRDRDNFIEMLWNNIPREWRSQFQKTDDSFGLQGSYDYYSIMHYRVNAPGTNKPAYNIRRGGIDRNRVGNGNDFTNTDLQKIRTLYC